MTVGENALRDNDFQRALKSFNIVITYKPDLFEPYFLRGVTKYYLGDYMGAEYDLTKSIEMHPLYSHAYHIRGVTRDQMQNYHNALRDYNKALEIDPFNADIYISRGTTRIHMKSFISAIEDFNQAVKYDANNADAYLKRAIAKEQLKDYEGAIKDCNDAIRLDYFNTGAYLRRGAIRMEIGEYEDALGDFQQAIRLDPDNSYAYFTRALVKIELADTAGAILDYNKVIEMDPYNALTYYNRGILYADIGKMEKAIEEFDKVLMLNPMNVYTYYNRAAARHSLGRYREAIDDYSEAIKIFPDFAGAYINRSAAWNNLKEYEKANNDYETAMEIINALHGESEYSEELFNKYADSAYYHKIIRFEADFNMGRPEKETLEEMEKTVVPASLFASHIILNEDLYIQLTRSGKHYERLFNFPVRYKETLQVGLSNQIPSATDRETTKLVKLADSLMIYNPLSPTVVYFVGLVNHMLKNYKDARDAYDRVIELNPDFELAYLNRSAVMYEQELMRYNEALYSSKVRLVWGDVDQDVAEREPELPDFSSSLKDLDKVIKLRPEWAIPYFNKGNILLAQKKYDEAIGYFSLAVDKEPGLAEAYFNRGLTQIFLNRLEYGCSDLSQAGELGIKDAYKAINRFCFKN